MKFLSKIWRRIFNLKSTLADKLNEDAKISKIKLINENWESVKIFVEKEYKNAAKLGNFYTTINTIELFKKGNPGYIWATRNGIKVKIVYGYAYPYVRLSW